MKTKQEIDDAIYALQFWLNVELEQLKNTAYMDEEDIHLLRQEIALIRKVIKSLKWTNHKKDGKVDAVMWFHYETITSPGIITDFDPYFEHDPTPTYMAGDVYERWT